MDDTRKIITEKATGKYIHFMNSNDYIDTSFLEKMVQTAEKYNSEIVISPYRVFDKENLKSYKFIPLMHTLINKENLNITNCRDLMSVTYHLWNKIFKKSSISDIKFSSINNDDDIWFWYNALLKSTGISIQRTSYYNHRTNINSVRINEANIKNVFSILEKTYKLFNENYKHLKPMFDMTVYSIISRIKDRNISILLKNIELKKYFYNQIKKLIDNMAVQKEYEKYFSWFKFNSEIFNKMKKCESTEDFDKIFNNNGCKRNIFKTLCNYIKFKTKK